MAMAMPPDLAVLSAIHRSEPVARREIAAQTGLSLNRVGIIVADLIAHQLICEETSQDRLPGRPANLLRVSPDAGYVIGLDIGGQHSYAALTDLAGNMLATVEQCTEPGPDRNLILDGVARLIQTVRQEADTHPRGKNPTAREPATLGIGLRGIVDTRSGLVLGWPNTPAWASAWSGMDLAAEIWQRTGIEKIVVEDSVRTMGLCAGRWGSARGVANFLYVFLGTGIGSALFMDGQPYRGGTGLAGELGHVTVDEAGPWCSCGNRGCLEVMASTPAVLHRIQERLAESHMVSALREPFERCALSLDALIEAAGHGDKIAFQILDQAGSYIGRVIAIALNMFGPELVILGGPLTQDNDIILEAVRRQVRLRALQQIASQTRIVADDQGKLAGARGAALLALDRLFTAQPPPSATATAKSPSQARGRAGRQ
jgi:N-acetylglucosamine repressor